MPSKHPPKTKITLALITLASAIPLPARAANPLAAPAPFAGTFSDDTLTLQLSETPTGYAGTLTQSGNKFPATATAAGTNLTGKFTASGSDYAFTATLANDQLTLLSGGATYTLKKAANNPLASNNPAPANPLAEGIATTPQKTADQPAGQSPGAFTVLGSTATGQTLFIKLPNANSVESAITQSADQSAKFFDAKPDLTGAFADSKTKGRGGALLTAKLKGKDVRGWIFCSAGAGGIKNGMTASLVYLSADAPKEDTAILFAYLPAQVKMETHQFPDGSGSVDLPPGWTTKQQSLTHGVAVFGPAGQTVVMQSTLLINTPTCILVRMGQQTYQTKLQTYQILLNAYQQNVQARQRFPNILALKEPVKPTPPDPEKDLPQFIFCPLCDGPEEVLKTLYPITETKAKNAGAPYSHLEKILAVVPADPNPLIPRAKAGVCYLLVTDHNGDKSTTSRVLNRIETYPVGDGADKWSCIFNTMRAPDATFDRDLPLMNDILSSFKINIDVVKKQIDKEGETVRKMGEDNERALLKRSQDFNKQQDENFQRFENQQIAQQNARHDSASDYIEMIRGVRDVYDTRTGEMHSVDLYNVNGIVNGMNDSTNDPNRFVQIPLRYER